MAGIGLELNKILARQGYTSTLQAYFYAAVIGSGPWLVTVAALGLLGAAMSTLTQTADVRLFFVSISFIYGVTLILTGPVQLVLTRYAADQTYTNKTERIFPTFVFCLAWISLVFTGVGLLIFVGFVKAPLLYRLSAALLTMLVACIWIAGIFLTALKDYLQVLKSFSIGCSVSFLAAWQLAVNFGVAGAMLGLAIGHAMLLILLCAAIYKEIGNHEMGRLDFLDYFVRYKELAACGFFYNAGIWIDKFLFWWFDPGAEQVSGMLYTSPIYDRVVYFSFLTIVPGMAVFLLKLETDFSIKNETFYKHVLKKGTLAQIKAHKRAMVRSLSEGFGLLFKVQGLCSALIMLSAGHILDFLGLGAVQSGVFQISVVATFLLLVFMSLLMILHYLDKRRDAMWCTIVFTLVNAGVTAWSIVAGERWFGLGFMVASGVGVVMAASWVNKHLRDLEFFTFTSQPLYG